jgi:hypothetical protein
LLTYRTIFNNTFAGALFQPTILVVTMSTAYAWQKVYQEAVLETDDARLQHRVNQAQAAIDARLLELSGNGKNAGEERTAIGDALNGLTLLRNERLQRPA